MLKRLFRLELIPITLILGAGLLFLFWEVIFEGYVQVPADIVLFDPVMQEALPNGMTQPQNPLLSDHIYQFYMWHSLAARSMQHTGKIPLWNPYILAGHPLVANAQSALFYPVNLLLYWFSPGTVATIRVFFNIAVAGIFTYLFGSALKMSRMGATLAAVAFAFSGAVMVGPGHAYANAIVWLPFIMWSAEKILNGSRVYCWGLVAAVGVGLSILGGHPETTFHNLFIYGLYFLVRLIFLDAAFAKKRRFFIAFAVSIGVGLLLGAIQLIPFAALLSQSFIVSRNRSWLVDSIYYSREWLPNVSTLVTLLYPNFFGHPADYTYLWPFSNYQNFLEQSMYFGLIPFALAVGAPFARQKKQRVVVIIIAILAALVLAVALRLPGFEAINYLPVFDKVNNTRFKWTFAFLGAVLAGFGLDAFGRYILSNRVKNGSVFNLAAFVILLSLAIFVIIGFWKTVVPKLLPITSDSFEYHLLFAIFSFQQPRTFISVVVVLLAIGAYWYFRNKPAKLPLFGALIIVVTLIELLVIAKGYNTTVPREIILPEVKLVQELRKDSDLFRIMPVDKGVFWPNYGAVYGLFHVGGYDLPGFKRYADIYLQQGGEDYRQLWSPDWPLVDWMNVKYVISVQEQNLDKFELALDGGRYKLYKNEDVLPRAYLVYHFDVIEDDPTALEVLTDGAFEFQNTVILSNDLPPAEAGAITPPANPAAQSVNVVAYDNDRVTLAVTTETPGILVMSDVHAPGWNVFVDDRQTNLYRANYTFRGVFVPAGQHTVTFNYNPLSFQIGRTLTLLGLGVLVVGLAFFCRRIYLPVISASLSNILLI